MQAGAVPSRSSAERGRPTQSGPDPGARIGGSAYARGQVSTGVPGLRLQGAGRTLADLAGLQRRAGEAQALAQRAQAHAHASHVRQLAVLTVALWLAALIVMLARI